MDVEAQIQRQGERIGAVLEELVLRPDATSDKGVKLLSEQLWYHLDSGGKRIRPALCLVTCEVLGEDSEKALYFAAAVELLHNMFLLHDDIADGDTMRHDRPSVWKKFGLGHGVNAGDYLLGLALRAVRRSHTSEAVRARLLDTFLATYLRTVEGQAEDIEHRCDAHFTVDDYLRITELKTGNYLVLGMVGGAIIAEASEVTVQCLQKLGENMGPAFQIRDDLIDLTLGKGRGGVTGSDIREGKPSILYAHALTHSMPGEEENRLVEIMRKPREETSDEDVQWVVAHYERCDSIAFAREKADELIRQAHKVLQYLPIEQQPFLRALADYMAARST
jgi:geranylgeranyl pyrophosphate synthase